MWQEKERVAAQEEEKERKRESEKKNNEKEEKEQQNGAGPTINRVGWRRLVAASSKCCCTIYRYIYIYQREEGLGNFLPLSAPSQTYNLLIRGFVHINVTSSFLSSLKELFPITFQASLYHTSYSFLG